MIRVALESLGGHLWTVAPVAESWVRPPRVDAGTPWQAWVEDASAGRVRLTGALHEPPAPTDTCLLVVHGLGGSIDSHYVTRTVSAALAAGVACLRLNLRGADGSGDDFYHGGLTDDVRAAVASPELARFRRLHALGFSLGGHLLLRWAALHPDPRLGAVAAVCPPLDLGLTQRDIDSPWRWPYRRYVLRALKELMGAVGRRRSLPVPTARMLAIGTMREWDDTLVAPRWGFASADDYYRRASAAPCLRQLEVPALLVGTRHDPMVLARSVSAALGDASAALEVRWLDRAGHVGFPADTTLGLDAPMGLEAQVVAWLRSRAG
jgi:predicted alpha/beta-fold hydrolase